METEAAPLVFEITRPEGLPPGEVGRIRRAMSLFRSLDFEPLKAMLAEDRKGEEASPYTRACVRFWAGEAAILANCGEEGSYDHFRTVVREDPEGAFASHAMRRMLWHPALFPRIVETGEPAVASLIQALRDPEAAPRAAKALKEITGQKFGVSFEKWSEWRKGRGK